MRFGQGLIQSLINPAYGQGLFNAAQSIGSMPGRMRAEEEQRLKQQQMAQLNAFGEQAQARAEQLRAKQRGMLLGDIIGGNDTSAQIATQGAVAAGVPLSEVSAASKIREAERTRGAAEQKEQLRRQGIDTIVGIVNSEDTSNPNVRKAIASIMARYGVKKEDIASLVPEAVSDIDTVGSSFKGMDSKGNYYSGIHTKNKGIQWEPYPGSPKTPVGKVSPVSATTGANLAVSQEAETAQRWTEQRETLISELPTLFEERSKIQRGLELAKVTETSGINEGIRAAKDFFGLGSTATEAELNNAMADFVLARIKTLGTNPTDTDLRFLNDAEANLRRSKEANVTLFKEALDKLNTTVVAREFLLDNPEASREDYIKNYKSLVENRSGVIKFNDLRRQ